MSGVNYILVHQHKFNYTGQLLSCALGVSGRCSSLLEEFQISVLLGGVSSTSPAPRFNGNQ